MWAVSVDDLSKNQTLLRRRIELTYLKPCLMSTSEQPKLLQWYQPLTAINIHLVLQASILGEYFYVVVASITN
jgi:hypothetical protein